VDSARRELQAVRVREGLSAGAEAGHDPAAVRTALLTGANVNEADGRSRDSIPPPPRPGHGLLRAAQRLVLGRKPDATKRRRVRHAFHRQARVASFAGGPAYRTIVAGARYSTCPLLTHKFRYRIYASEFDRGAGQPMMTWRTPPEPSGEEITIFYAPATQADQALIAAYMPKPNATGARRPSTSSSRSPCRPTWSISGRSFASTGLCVPQARP